MCENFDEKLISNIENIVFKCLQYANNEINQIEDIYMYISYEGLGFFNVFYKLENGRIYKKHKISEIIKTVDSSLNAQSLMNKSVNKDMLSIKSLFEQDNREVPNQIRIQYRTILGKNKIKFLYDKSHNDDLLIGDHEIFDDWLNQVNNGIGDLF